jgi:hypothetical protein
MEVIPMTVREAANRGRNFFATAVLAMLATSVVHGLQVADSLTAAVDDLSLGAVAVGAVAWYLWRRNRYRRSRLPLVFLALGLASKLVGMWLADGRLPLGGPDFALAAFLAETAVVFTWQYLAAGGPDDLHHEHRRDGRPSGASDGAQPV